MKAIVATQYGSPEVLELQEVAKPTPKADEVLVKVYATTVTAGDARTRSFNVPRSLWIPARLTLGLTKPKKAILKILEELKQLNLGGIDLMDCLCPFLVLNGLA